MIYASNSTFQSVMNCKMYAVSVVSIKVKGGQCMIHT